MVVVTLDAISVGTEFATEEAAALKAYILRLKISLKNRISYSRM